MSVFSFIHGKLLFHVVFPVLKEYSSAILESAVLLYDKETVTFELLSACLGERPSSIWRSVSLWMKSTPSSAWGSAASCL